MKILAGLLSPKEEAGRGVFIDNVPVQEKSGEIAFISEAGSYLKDLTPMEFGAFLADFYPSFDMEYYQKLLKFFQLEEKPIKKMSKGQKARVCKV